MATTVIENGVDMPNVNTIIVLSAERYRCSEVKCNAICTTFL